MSTESRYVVVGLGGVGGTLLEKLVGLLYAQGGRATIYAVDGDHFEEANRGRQSFHRLGPKAVVHAEDLLARYGDRITIVPVPEYLTPQRARHAIRERDLVFCTPDNHRTRRLVERRCARLDDVALFSGGNDGVEDDKSGTFGNVQVYLRENGRNATNPISAFHPEIRDPKDELPGDRGCADLVASAPQLLVTNLAVASSLLSAYYSWRAGELDYEELYLDVVTGRHVPVRRELLDPARGPVRSRTAAPRGGRGATPTGP